jgi:hypothetical protein
MPQDLICVNRVVIDFFVGLASISNYRGWGTGTLQIPRQGKEEGGSPRERRARRPEASRRHAYTFAILPA